MLASNIPPTTKPCSSCGACSGSQPQFSCQPSHHIEQGRFRGAARDARRSALILENRRIQDAMIAGVKDPEPPQRQAPLSRGPESSTQTSTAESGVPHAEDSALGGLATDVEKNLAHVVTLRDLYPLDILVLRDLVRFGVLADDQIQRRYGSTAISTDRLALLESGGFVNKPRADVIQGTVIYTATRYGTLITRCGLGWRTPLEGHLAHDIAVVDLADYLLEHNPEADWKTEREVGRVLRAAGPAMRARGLPKGRRHTPDGLLVSGGKRLAIELEHSDKGEQRYIGICRWFACELRLDGVRWYVDNPKIIARILKANRQHGFDRDIDVKVEPFPPGVVVRSQARPWAR